MKQLLLLAIALMSTAQANAQNVDRTLKKIQFDTHLRYLDNKDLVKCHEGFDGGFSFPSNMELKEVVLSTPSRNTGDFLSENFNQGLKCPDLERIFNAEKTEHGTIPVTVTITVKQGFRYGTYTLVKEDGENIGSRSSTHDVIYEKIEFDVGTLRFASFRSFNILAGANGEDIIDLTP